MQQIKICPDCACEYYAHIECCADCGAVLLTQEELKMAEEEKKQTLEKALENQVVVREGEFKWMRELSAVLIDSGIPCMIDGNAGCNKGCSGSAHQLMVSSQDVEKAHERIEAYFTEIHPEIQTSNEMVKQGKCPACSAHAGPDAVECPECGLTLLSIEEP
jgi:hypothetical protein